MPALIGSRRAALSTGVRLALWDFVSAGALPSWLTLTRATTGTYIDASGIMQTAAINVARFDHNRSGSGIGLLTESAGTNSAYPSGVFTSGGVWAPSNMTFPASSIGLDGTVSARKAVPATNANTAYDVCNTAASNAILSCYATPAGYNYFILVRGLYAAGDYAIFNVNSGVVAQAPTFAGSSATITPAPSGFFQCVLKSNQVTSVSAFAVSPANNLTTAPNGSDGVTLCDFSASLGASYVGSYIPTTVSAATRAADVLSLADGYAGNPIIVETQSEATGAISRTLYNPGSGISALANVWLHTIGVYRPGTPMAYLNAIVAGGAW